MKLGATAPRAEAKTSGDKRPPRPCPRCLVRGHAGRRASTRPQGRHRKASRSPSTRAGSRRPDRRPAAPRARAVQPLRLRAHAPARALQQGRARAGSRLPRGAPPSRAGARTSACPSRGTARRPSGTNNFQGRYVIRHPWTGPMSCEHPKRGVWGGPPPGVHRATPPPKPALKVAFAPRGQDLVLYLREAVPRAAHRSARVARRRDRLARHRGAGRPRVRVLRRGDGGARPPALLHRSVPGADGRGAAAPAQGTVILWVPGG